MSKVQSKVSHSKGLMYALGAGFMGAMASVGAKLMFSASETLQEICVNTQLFCGTLLPTIRFVSAGLVILSNILMWVLFTKSLIFCQSSVEASITNTAAGFFTSGICGWLLFGERLTPVWWCGASLIIIGILLINKGSQTDEKREKVS